MDERIKNILFFIEEYKDGKMWKTTMEQNIETEIDEIKAEAIQDLYANGLAIPIDDTDSMLEVLRG